MLRWKLSAWEIFRENIKIAAKNILVYFELHEHKPWFNEGYLKLLDYRRQALFQ
jgi:hypothetical protein